MTGCLYDARRGPDLFARELPFLETLNTTDWIVKSHAMFSAVGTQLITETRARSSLGGIRFHFSTFPYEALPLHVAALMSSNRSGALVFPGA